MQKLLHTHLIAWTVLLGFSTHTAAGAQTREARPEFQKVIGRYAGLSSLRLDMDIRLYSSHVGGSVVEQYSCSFRKQGADFVSDYGDYIHLRSGPYMLVVDRPGKAI